MIVCGVRCACASLSVVSPHCPLGFQRSETNVGDRSLSRGPSDGNGQGGGHYDDAAASGRHASGEHNEEMAVARLES